ncbi:MAG: type I DNA topoisomerase [Clostridiales bacterium]|nr:type I DNA topoisomerase [Clostridiales bacterium]MDY3831482.1 type I DNA topoisomerase [Candidatus Ventricola sp.]
MSSHKTAHKLVIVESPAKARTISKFLGRTYKVEASNGHVRDLPKSQLGVDIEHDFEPKYITIRGRGEVLERIRKEARSAKSVILATDPDREGEAISWHLAHILGIDPDSACRVEFNEITEKTVKSAIKQPRAINQQLVDAQQARRMLDRLVGYKISPLLWVKIKKGLSAGRVQSVATRMICDRETEIETFEPEEYWHVTAKLRAGGKTLEARLYSLDGERVSLSDEQAANDAKARIAGGGFVIKSVKRGERHKHPAPPFTTSNLQQEASRKLGFTTSKTMQIAQQLYEGVDIEGRGTLGLISYIRTDSVRLSDEAVSAAREAIESRYGAEYVPEKPVVYKGRKSAQDAHEAIRPASIDLRPEDIKASLTRDQFNLYKLVYLRFIACQMADAVYETQQIEIANDSGVVLRSSAERLKFAGFTAVYEEGRDDGVQDEQIAGALEDVSEGSEAVVEETEATQHFTQAPPRYTEASLVRALEEKGIGRPSTYAPTISTILARGYVTREKKQLYPTELGVMITDMMKEHFTDIVDIAFTAGMEEQLDEVEEGKRGWRDVLRDFYGPFEKTLEKAEAEIEKVEIKDEVSDVVCDKCGAMMVYKFGRFGRFLACPNFPECRNTKAIQVEIAAPCPVCGGKLLEKTSRKGRKFYGCERYPECDFVSWEMPVEQKCPKCGGYMVLKRGRKGESYYLCANENCRERVAAPASEEENE